MVVHNQPDFAIHLYNKQEAIHYFHYCEFIAILPIHVEIRANAIWGIYLEHIYSLFPDCPIIKSDIDDLTEFMKKLGEYLGT